MSLAPKKSLRPKRNPMNDPNSPQSVEGRSTREMKKGGKVEGSAKDMREDKAMAKKSGMSMAKWEKSAADKKHDAPKKMAGGGMCGTKKMVTGGTVARGMGAAKRGGAFGKNG
jgi:hypothetical protein